MPANDILSLSRSAIRAPDYCVLRRGQGLAVPATLRSNFFPGIKRSVWPGSSTLERNDNPMQSIEIHPGLNRLVLAEAAKLYPEFADQASHVIARPLAQGFAW